MSEKDKIIEGMCLTWRHDYGLLKTSEERELVGDVIFKTMCGMTSSERQSLYSNMAQVYAHNIQPEIDRLNEQIARLTASLKDAQRDTAREIVEWFDEDSRAIEDEYLRSVNTSLLEYLSDTIKERYGI